MTGRIIPEVSLFYYEEGKSSAPEYQDNHFMPVEIEKGCKENIVAVCTHSDTKASESCMIEWCITKDEDAAADVLQLAVDANKLQRELGMS